MVFPGRAPMKGNGGFWRKSWGWLGTLGIAGTIMAGLGSGPALGQDVFPQESAQPPRAVALDFDDFAGWWTLDDLTAERSPVAMEKFMMLTRSGNQLLGLGVFLNLDSLSLLELHILRDQSLRGILWASFELLAAPIPIPVSAVVDDQGQLRITIALDSVESSQLPEGVGPFDPVQLQARPLRSEDFVLAPPSTSEAAAIARLRQLQQLFTADYLENQDFAAYQGQLDRQLLTLEDYEVIIDIPQGDRLHVLAKPQNPTVRAYQGSVFITENYITGIVCGAKPGAISGEVRPDVAGEVPFCPEGFLEVTD